MAPLLTELQASVLRAERNGRWTPAEPKCLLTLGELLHRCQCAARAAVRGDSYSPEDRADCAADIMAELTAELAEPITAAEARPPRRRGRPTDVLAWITAAEFSAETGFPMSADWRSRSKAHGSPETVLRFIASIEAAEAAAPRRSVEPMSDDARITFTALYNRGRNWRRTLDRNRDRDALMSGRKAVTVRPHHEDLPSGYLAAEAAQSRRKAEAAAREACQRLDLPAGLVKRVRLTAMITREQLVRPSAAFCLLYQWSTGAEAEQCAADLGTSWDSWRQRTSRAAAVIRKTFSLAEVIARLTYGGIVRTASRDLFTMAARHDSGRGRRANHKARIVPSGSVIFALDAEAAEAHGRSPIMAIDWRDGTAAGQWPERPTDVTSAREACSVRYRKAAPVSTARRRAEVREAAGYETPVHEHAEHLGKLGTALGGQRGRMPRGAVGQTAGSPRDKYAPRAVRLGPNS